MFAHGLYSIRSIDYLNHKKSPSPLRLVKPRSASIKAITADMNPQGAFVLYCICAPPDTSNPFLLKLDWEIAIPCR